MRTNTSRASRASRPPARALQPTRPRWSWKTVLVVLLLVGLCFGFEVVLVFHGTDLRAASGIAFGQTIGIVGAVQLRTRGLSRRLGQALRVYLDDGDPGE